VVTELVRVHRLTDQEGQKLQQIVRRGSTSSVRYRRAMMLLASAGGNRVPVIAQLVQADEDTVRDVIHRFNEIGLACLDPRWAGGRPHQLSPDDADFVIQTATTLALHRYLRRRNANARHPDVLAAQRRERARIRGEGASAGRTPPRRRSLTASDSEAPEDTVVVDGAGELLEVHVRAREVVLDAPQLGCHNADTTLTITPQVHHKERQFGRGDSCGVRQYKKGMPVRGMDQVDGLVRRQALVPPVIDDRDVGQEAVLAGRIQRRPKSVPGTVRREVSAHNKGFQSAGELHHARTVPPSR
jgi:transposase